MMNIIIYLILSYIVGSIPFGLIIGKLFKGIDLREHGSKNIGTTNMFRVLGYKYAIPVLILDASKSYLATIVGFEVNNIFNEDLYLLPILGGSISILGHVFSIFLKLKGGKGVASTLGVIIGLNPIISLISFILFTIVFLISRMVSLGSLISALFFPMIIFYFNKENDSISLYIFGFIITILIYFTHRENIKRLIKGNEKKLF